MTFRVDPYAMSRMSVQRALWCAQPVLHAGEAPLMCQVSISSEKDQPLAGFERFARKQGWKKTDQHGWCCPVCWEKLDGLRNKSRKPGRGKL